MLPKCVLAELQSASIHQHSADWTIRDNAELPHLRQANQQCALLPAAPTSHARSTRDAWGRWVDRVLASSVQCVRCGRARTQVRAMRPHTHVPQLCTTSSTQLLLMHEPYPQSFEALLLLALDLLVYEYIINLVVHSFKSVLNRRGCASPSEPYFSPWQMKWSSALVLW